MHVRISELCLKHNLNKAMITIHIGRLKLVRAGQSCATPRGAARPKDWYAATLTRATSASCPATPRYTKSEAFAADGGNRGSGSAQRQEPAVRQAPRSG